MPSVTPLLKRFIKALTEPLDGNDTRDDFDPRTIPDMSAEDEHNALIIASDGTMFLFSLECLRAGSDYDSVLIPSSPPFPFEMPEHVDVVYYLEDATGEPLSLVLQALNAEDEDWMPIQYKGSDQIATFTDAIALALRYRFGFVDALAAAIRVSDDFVCPFFRTFLSVLQQDEYATRENAWSTLPLRHRSMHPHLRKLWKQYAPRAFAALLDLHKRHHKHAVSLINAMWSFRFPGPLSGSFHEYCKPNKYLPLGCNAYQCAEGDWRNLRNDSAVYLAVAIFSNRMWWDRMLVDDKEIRGRLDIICPRCADHMARVMHYIIGKRFAKKLALDPMSKIARTPLHILNEGRLVFRDGQEKLCL